MPMCWLKNLISTLRYDSTLEKLKGDPVNKTGEQRSFKTSEEGGVETDTFVG